MKTLDEALRIEGDHVIIDCCPREGSRELPFEGLSLQLSYGEGVFSEFSPRRRKYTLCLNIGVLVGLAYKGKSLRVKCPKCTNIFELTRDKVYELLLGMDVDPLNYIPRD